MAANFQFKSLILIIGILIFAIVEVLLFWTFEEAPKARGRKGSSSSGSNSDHVVVHETHNELVPQDEPLSGKESAENEEANDIFSTGEQGFTVEMERKAEEEGKERSGEITHMALLVRSVSSNLFKLGAGRRGGGGSPREDSVSAGSAALSDGGGWNPTLPSTPTRRGRRGSSPANLTGFVYSTPPGSSLSVRSPQSVSEEGGEVEDVAEQLNVERVRSSSTIAVESNPLTLRRVRELQAVLRRRAALVEGTDSPRDYADYEI
eukprot:gene67-66_t